MYLLTDLAPWPSGVTVGWINTSPFTRKLATTNPLLIPAATLEKKKCSIHKLILSSTYTPIPLPPQPRQNLAPPLLPHNCRYTYSCIHNIQCSITTHSPQSGLKVSAVMGVAGMHCRQKVAWKPAGTWMGSVLHSRGCSFRRPALRSLVWLPRKISALSYCQGEAERERERENDRTA